MPPASRALPLLAAAAAAAGAALPLRPNMVWIMSDDLGYGEVSAMPGRTNTNITTPRIDSLLASGLTFTNAYAGEAVCAPSRATLMTGRHTGHTHIRGNAGSNGHDLPLLANETTFLQLLQGAGYHVACVGKWGLGWWDSTGSPTAKGCDTYYGVLGQNDAHNMYPSLGNFTWRYPAANGSAVWEELPIPANEGASRQRCMADGNTCVWTQDLWTNAALDALEAHAGRVAALGAAAAPPLFLYVAYTTPHAGGWSGVAEEGNPVPSDGGFAKFTGWPVAERDHASVIANFQDRDVGALVDALAAHGLTNSTLVAFASDNGASNEGNHDYAFFGSSGPLRGFKRCLTEGGIRTALGVAWPGVIPAGGVTNYTAAFWDFLPTFLELAGVPPAQWPETDGTSLVPLLTGSPESQPPHPPLYWEFCTATHPPGTNRTGTGWGHAVRMGDWKGVSLFKGVPLELYNLADDIGETTNVAAAHPDVIAAMEAFAASAHVDNPLFPANNNCNPS